MAEEKETNPWEPLLFIIGLLFVLLALLWARGGLKSINGQGLFIAPPVQVGSSTTAISSDSSSNTTNPTQ